MSLIPSANAGAPGDYYFIENIGGQGETAADAPCIKGTTLGTVRVGNPAAGVLIRGDLLSSVTPANRIAGGQTAGGSMAIGNSTTSFQNIVLTDGATTVNTPLTIDQGFGVITDGDVSCGGNLVLANGPSQGKSISNYWSAQVTGLPGGGGAFANPAGLTQGVYFVVYVGSGAGNEFAQPSGVFYWSGTTWAGNAVSFNFTAGAPNCAIGPVAGGATLTIGGAAIPAGTAYFRKILN